MTHDSDSGSPIDFSFWTDPQQSKEFIGAMDCVPDLMMMISQMDKNSS